MHVQPGSYQGFYLDTSGAPGSPIAFVATGAGLLAFQRLGRGGMEVRMEKRVDRGQSGRHSAGGARVREGGEVG